MMMARLADDDVIAAVKLREYPRLIIAGMMIGPVAATSATAEPEISAKNIEETTFTCASAPRIEPTSAVQKSIRRREIEDEFMTAPAKMNIGMAISGKLEAPSCRTRAALTSICGP